MRFFGAHKDEASVVVHVQPLVEIKRYRVGALQSGQAWAQALAQNTQGSERAIDVQPELFCLRDIGQGLQIVDGTDVHSACRADDEKGREVGRPVLRDGRLKCLGVDLEAPVDSDLAQCFGAQAQDVEGPGHAGVGLLRGVTYQPASRGILQPGFAAAEVKAAVARRFQGNDGGDRCAAHDQAAGRRWKLKQLAAPVHHLLFHIHRAVVAPAEVGIDGCGSDVGHEVARRARAMHPAKKAGVGVAYAVGQQGLHVGLGGFWPDAHAGQRRLVVRLQRLWQRGPDRAFSVALHAVHRSVQQAVGLGAKGVPVGGVQRLFGRKGRVWVRFHGLSFRCSPAGRVGGRGGGGHLHDLADQAAVVGRERERGAQIEQLAQNAL